MGGDEVEKWEMIKFRCGVVWGKDKVRDVVSWVGHQRDRLKF